VDDLVHHKNLKILKLGLMHYTVVTYDVDVAYWTDYSKAFDSVSDIEKLKGFRG